MHFTPFISTSNMPFTPFTSQPLGDGSTQPQGSHPSGKNKQVLEDTITAQSEGEINAEVSLPVIPYIPPYIVSEPSTPNPSSKSLSDSSPPKDSSTAREPSPEDICHFVYLSDSNSEEEGQAPGHEEEEIIREPEEEQRSFLIRQFEAARVKIPLRTSGPAFESESHSIPDEDYPAPLSVIDEFDFLTKEQRAEALEEQKKIDAENESLRLAKRLQRQEGAQISSEESNEEKSRRLAERLAQRDLQRENIKVDPIKAQERLFQSLMKPHASENEEIEWCQKKLHYRKSEARITNISVQGITYKQGKNKKLKVYTTISRGGSKENKDGAQFLKLYGFTEWLEIREALQRSKSKFKGLVEQIINQLLERMSKHVDVPPLPEKTRKRKGESDNTEGDPSFRNESEIKFGIDDVLAHLVLPDLSMLDTSFPEARHYEEREVVSRPIAGMVFLANDGTLKFFRNSEIQKAPTKLIKMMYYYCWNDNDPLKLQKYVYEKELRRRQEDF